MDIAAAAPRLPLAGRSINDLPLDVLLRVLSHMDALRVVQTAQLLRLWRDLWRDVPRINVLRQEFGTGADGLGYEEHNPLFKEFVTRLLMLRKPVALVKFNLCHYVGSQIEADTADANRWIHHALLWNAQSVNVSVWGNFLELDHAAFTLHHLTTLRLRCCELAPGSFGHLQTVCKVLEWLILEDCAIGDTEISSQTLKILSFTSGGPASISIPSLLYFAFSDFPGERLPLIVRL